jgi:hypothetical protein
MKRTAAIAIVAMTVLTACGIQDSYPLPDEPPGASTFHPVGLGEPVTEAVLFIEARPRTFVEIVSGEPIGQFEGATVTLHAATMTEDAAGDVVVSDERHELNGLRIEDMVDASANSPENMVAIVAEVTADEPGHYIVTGVLLNFRINGAPERGGEGIDVVMNVCADDPAPTECE